MTEVPGRFRILTCLFNCTFIVMVLLSLFAGAGSSFAAEPSIVEPPSTGLTDYETFSVRYAAMEERRAALSLRIEEQVLKCKSVGSNNKQLIIWCNDKNQKIAPLWKKYEEDAKQYREDLRAALISGRSSSSEDEMAILIGHAFNIGHKMRAYANKYLTSMKDISRLIISVWHAERGSYQKARHLAHVKDITEEELKEMDDILLSLELEQRVLLKHAINRIIISGDFDSRFFSQYPNKFSISLLEAHMNIKSQNYDVALSKVASAKKMNIESQMLADAEVYIRQMKTSAVEKQLPTDPALITHQKNIAGAYAGLSLGMLLMDADMDATAIQVLTKSAEALAIEGNIEDSTDIYKLVNSIPENDGKNQNWLPSPGIYDSATEADILLDSLEYGGGDWNKSLLFLELAHKASPDNERINEAIAHTQALIASQK